MLVLGLVLIVISAGALAAVLASGLDDKAALYGGGLEMPTLVIFLLGAATLLVFVVGLELLRSGLRRANQNRKNNKRLRQLEQEREQVRTQPGAEPVTEGAAGPAASPAGAEAGRGGPYQEPPAPTR